MKRRVSVYMLSVICSACHSKGLRPEALTVKFAGYDIADILHLYHRDSDWVFASNKTKGKTPRSAGVAGQDYLRPAAVKAGAISAKYRGRFGWHNLRYSLAAFFAANEISFSIIQSMMRHAKPTTTAIYTHRINAAQMAAQGNFLKAINVRSAVALEQLWVEPWVGGKA